MLNSFTLRLSAFPSSFVKQFYDMLARNPSELHRFYTEESSFCHAEHPSEPTTTVKGMDAIRKRVAELNLLNAHVDLSEGAYDVQESFANVAAILVVVTGHFSLNNAQPNPFTHTFVLAKPENATNGAAYYVRNSVFRQQSVPAVIARDPVATADPLPASVAAVNVIEEAAAEEPVQPAPAPVSAPAPEEEPVVVAAEPEVVATPAPVAAAAPATAPPAVASVESAPASKARLSFAEMAKRNAAGSDTTLVLPSAPRSKAAPAAPAAPADAVVAKDVKAAPEQAPKEKGEKGEKKDSKGNSNSPQQRDRDRENSHNSMYIRQVTQKVTEPALRELFGAFGSITRCDLQANKGFAFIDFSTRESLDQALSQKNIVCNGVNLKVEERAPKTKDGEKVAGAGQGRSGAAASGAVNGSGSSKKDKEGSNKKDKDAKGQNAGGGGGSGGGAKKTSGGAEKKDGEKPKKEKAAAEVKEGGK